MTREDSRQGVRRLVVGTRSSFEVHAEFLEVQCPLMMQFCGLAFVFEEPDEHGTILRDKREFLTPKVGPKSR